MNKTASEIASEVLYKLATSKELRSRAMLERKMRGKAENLAKIQFGAGKAVTGDPVNLARDPLIKTVTDYKPNEADTSYFKKRLYDKMTRRHNMSDQDIIKGSFDLERKGFKLPGSNKVVNEAAYLGYLKSKVNTKDITRVKKVRKHNYDRFRKTLKDLKDIKNVHNTSKFRLPSMGALNSMVLPTIGLGGLLTASLIGPQIYNWAKEKTK